MVALPDPLNGFSVAVTFETVVHDLRVGFSIVAGGAGTPATSISVHVKHLIARLPVGWWKSGKL
jgi:hypothetical protein